MRTIDLGDGVRLRAVREDEAEKVAESVHRNYDHLVTFMEWAKPDYSEADAAAYIGRAKAGRDEHTGLSFGIFRGDEFVGSIGMDSFDRGPNATEIGYWIAADEEGKGIISKATAKLVDLAFSELGMNRVQIRCAAANNRSAAVPERLGFTKEGVQRQAIIRNGKVYDFVIYGLLKSEWKNKTEK